MQYDPGKNRTQKYRMNEKAHLKSDGYINSRQS